jgi:hypothetical protein
MACSRAAGASALNASAVQTTALSATSGAHTARSPTHPRTRSPSPAASAASMTRSTASSAGAIAVTLQPRAAEYIAAASSSAAGDQHVLAGAGRAQVAQLAGERPVREEPPPLGTPHRGQLLQRRRRHVG